VSREAVPTASSTSDGPVVREPVLLETNTPARERLATDLLRWGTDRPVAPPGLADRLEAMLEAGLGGLREELTVMAATRPRRTVTVTKTGLGRLVCDGWQLDPQPYSHTRANVRGRLAGEAIAADWSGWRHAAAGDLVDRVWYEVASRRPGDPASLSAWLNSQPSRDADTLRGEIADLIEAFREVWPPLPPEAVVCRVARPLEVSLAGGLVTLQGVPDLVLDSRRDDDHARALVVDVKTGQPRSEEADRHELRFYALLVTLETGKPPFRWASFYVAEGRSEAEDLGEAALEAAAQRVLEGVRQLVRVDARTGSGEHGLRLQAGSWCRFCLRADSCEVAAAAG